MMTRRMKAIAIVLITSTGLSSLPVQAIPITTEEATTAAGFMAERDRLASLLARADVQQGLAAYGVSADDAKARVAALSDDEVRQLNQRLDKVPAGGDIIGVIVFLFLVLLVTDILGLTKIFPFTRPIR
jgi:hypothetical protein